MKAFIKLLMILSVSVFLALAVKLTVISTFSGGWIEWSGAILCFGVAIFLLVEYRTYINEQPNSQP